MSSTRLQGKSEAHLRRKFGTSAASLRLQADLKSISQEPPDGCSASPTSDGNLFVWSATIFGPDDTPWEGGIFSLRITFPEHYPEKPPRVRFTSAMFHPNVYTDGTLCLDIIQDMWSPCQSVSTILTSVQSLLQDPNCASPANPEAAQLYTSNLKEYNRRAWFYKYDSWRQEEPEADGVQDTADRAAIGGMLTQARLA